jgi:DNA-binding transcriptional regulator YhcF (GntR family)
VASAAIPGKKRYSHASAHHDHCGGTPTASPTLAPAGLFDQGASHSVRRNGPMIELWLCIEVKREHLSPLPTSDSIISIMLPVQVDPSDPSPLHEQVAGRLRRAIADGEAGPGQRLPPARDLASVLGVNSNTVLRALRDLREEGLLEFRRGRGITVAGDAPERGFLIERARELMMLARRQGYDKQELLQVIENLT